METVIQTSQLSRRFKETLAVDNLTLEIKRGEIFGLLGHNGAGKTTTVRLLNGVLNPTSGTATVLGLSPQTQGATLRQKTGVLTETPALYEKLSARTNLNIFAEVYNLPKADIPRRINDLLAQFDLTARADEKVGGYSKGMKQRLALARAFLHQPELLFLDEPTSGLDPLAARQVNDSILELSREHGRTVILATHNLHDAQQLCDRVAVLEHGKVVLSGKPSELARHFVQMRQVKLTVKPEQVGSALSILEPYAQNVTHDDEGGITANDLAYDKIPDVIQQFVEGRIAVYQITPHDPTLEDVYFALHQEKTV